MYGAPIDLSTCRTCAHRAHDPLGLFEKLAQAQVRLFFAYWRPWLPLQLPGRW